MTHPPISDEAQQAAREPTDAELAELLRKEADNSATMSVDELLLAAHRLEASPSTSAQGEISEAMVEIGGRALCHQIRNVLIMAGDPDPWLRLDANAKRRYRNWFRAALTAALSGKEE